MCEISNSIDSCYASDDFWDVLLDRIEEGKVIPVLGCELVTIAIENEEIPLYRLIATRLLKKHKIGDDEVELKPHQELNDAVVALKNKGKPIQDLYGQINRILKDIMTELDNKKATMSSALRELAGITSFDIFITTTFDDFLIDTVDDIRTNGAKNTEKIVYAPNLPDQARRDIPEVKQSNYHAVFYLFGEASTSPTYAIHDEDTLEYLYSILTESGKLPERLIGDIRNRDLLLIGCNFADWLSRFFIRLSNQQRLASVHRDKREFLVGKELATDSSLTVFLERFSQNSRLCACDAETFVRELAERWRAAHPTEKASSLPDRTPDTGDIFISYSHHDVGAAKTLCEELDGIGGGVVWFDKTALWPGDEWGKKIDAAINGCKIFLPLISSTTAKTVDGYFAKEWNLAVNRKKTVPGRSYDIIPVIIEEEKDGTTDAYTHWIPELFKEFHVGHAPNGHMNKKLREKISEKLRDLRRPS